MTTAVKALRHSAALADHRHTASRDPLVDPTAECSRRRRSTAAASHLSPFTLRELAQGRRATAKYHDVADASADGYADVNPYTSGEGYHYINLLLVDRIFNLEQPEGLLYADHPGEDGLKLVEYIADYDSKEFIRTSWPSHGESGFPLAYARLRNTNSTELYGRTRIKA